MMINSERIFSQKINGNLTNDLKWHNIFNSAPISHLYVYACVCESKYLAGRIEMTEDECSN